jgi:hypothetical protein
VNKFELPKDEDEDECEPEEEAVKVGTWARRQLPVRVTETGSFACLRPPEEIVPPQRTCVLRTR